MCYMMDFTKFDDINDFYRKTGMTRLQAFNYLKKQLEEREGKTE